MKVFLIIDETNFYQPNFISQLLKCKDHDFIGCALVVKIPVKNSIEKYMIKNVRYLTISEILKLCLRKLKYYFLDLFQVARNRNFYSVRSVLKYYDIPFFSVKNDINNSAYLEKIRLTSPDVILSSNSLYFKKELLSIPKFCINRHSSLLPSYGGLWPIFQALREQEKYVGVSVHLMTEDIDVGKILAQKEVKILKNDTVSSLYEKCFEISASVSIDALNLLSLDLQSKTNLNKGIHKKSYYSFPSKDQWNEFRSNKCKFI